MERRLLLESGLELSAAGGNNAALGWFGLKWMTLRDFRDSLANLAASGLPNFLAPSAEDCMSKKDVSFNGM